MKNMKNRRKKEQELKKNDSDRQEKLDDRKTRETGKWETWRWKGIRKKEEKN